MLKQRSDAGDSSATANIGTTPGQHNCAIGIGRTLRGSDCVCPERTTREQGETADICTLSNVAGKTLHRSAESEVL